MRVHQLLRIDKIYDQPIYLLTKSHEDNKFVFEVCGTTKNIYKVQIYKKSKMIYCNCPDSKSYAKQNGVVCKHCCFILLKVLNLINSDDFFNMLLFDEKQLEYIKNEFNKLEFIENEYIKMDYVDKFNKLHDDKILIKDDMELFCLICYDELETIENKNINNQCKYCLKIFHNSCINKWLNMGNDNCPHCRNIMKSNNYKYLE
jgi:hypothetical protein